MAIKVKQIKKFLEKLFMAIIQHAFWVCLILFFLSLIFGGYLFYENSTLVKKTEIQVLDEPPLLKEKTYQDILEVWQEQERKFKETDFKEYPDPFRKQLATPERAEES